MSKNLIVVGVGGAGGVMVNHLSKNSDFIGTGFLYIDSDKDSLDSCNGVQKIQIGKDRFADRGSSGLVDDSRTEAKKSMSMIMENLKNYDKAAILFGASGGIGGGAGIEIAKAVKDAGLSELVIVTTPFSFEAGTIKKRADSALEELYQLDIETAQINLQKILETAPKGQTMSETHVQVAYEVGDIIAKRLIEDE